MELHHLSQIRVKTVCDLNTYISCHYPYSIHHYLQRKARYPHWSIWHQLKARLILPASRWKLTNTIQTSGLTYRRHCQKQLTQLPFQHSCSTSAIVSLITRFIYTDTICSPSSSKHLRTQLPVAYMLAAPNPTCQSASLFATQVTENRRISYENKIKINTRGSRLIKMKSLFHLQSSQWTLLTGEVPQHFPCTTSCFIPKI